MPLLRILAARLRPLADFVTEGCKIVRSAWRSRSAETRWLCPAGTCSAAAALTLSTCGCQLMATIWTAVRPADGRSSARQASCSTRPRSPSTATPPWNYTPSRSPRLRATPLAQTGSTASPPAPSTTSASHTRVLEGVLKLAQRTPQCINFTPVRRLVQTRNSQS